MSQPAREPWTGLEQGATDLQALCHLVLAFARVLQQNGESTADTVFAAEDLARRLGLSARIIPGWEELRLEAEDGPGLSSREVEPISVDMNRVASAAKAMEEVAAGRLSAPAAMEVLHDISRAPPSPTWLFTLAAAAGAAALSLIFGAKHIEAIALIVASAALGALLRRTAARYSTNPLLQPLCAAPLAGVIGALAVGYNLSSSLRLVAVCPCMILVPGQHVLNGMMDLAAVRVPLGASRLLYAALILLAISAGLLVALRALGVSLPVDPSGRTVSLWLDMGAAGVAAAAYGVFYSMRLRRISSGWTPRRSISSSSCSPGRICAT